MAFIRHNVRTLAIITLALACSALAIVWPGWRAELRAQISYEQKPPLSKLAAELSVDCATAAVVAAVCTIPPLTPVCAVPGGLATAGICALAALVAKQAADPPDPNFMVIAQPIIPSFPPVLVEPGITQAEADAWNALLDNLTQAIGVGDALLKSVERAQGAAQAGNVFWETQQTQLAAGFALQYATLLNAQPTLRINLQDALQAAGFSSIPITETDVSNFQNDVFANSLPPSLTNALTQLGANSVTIEEIEDLILAQDPQNVTGSFPEILTDQPLISALQDAAQALTPVCATNVSAQVSVSRSGFRRNSATGRYVQQVTLKNTSSNPIAGPVSLVLDGLSGKATLFNKSGITACAAPTSSPFINVNVGTDNSLSVGERASVVLEFTNPANRGISYTTRVLVGSGTK